MCAVIILASYFYKDASDFLLIALGDDLFFNAEDFGETVGVLIALSVFLN